jgi:DNA-binding FrmR family transcriptional regulator
MRRIANRTAIFLTILAALLFPACAKRDLSVAKSGAPGRLAMAGVETERLHVLTASQTVEVKEIASAMKQVDSVIQKSGGYVQSQSVREEEQAYLVLRVPAPQLRQVLDAVAALGSEESRSVASQDVTEQYIDAEARLKNAIALRDRLKALLGQAKGVKDILEIEKELTRVQSDIDSMEGRLKKLKGQVDFAQIDLALKRKKILGPLGYIVYGIGWVIQKLFVIN